MSVIRPTAEIHRENFIHASRLSRSLKVIATDADRSATCDFLLVSNREPISYCFRDKRRFRSRIANFAYRPRVALKKTTVMPLRDGGKTFRIGSFVFDTIDLPCIGLI